MKRSPKYGHNSLLQHHRPCEFQSIQALPGQFSNTPSNITSQDFIEYLSKSLFFWVFYAKILKNLATIKLLRKPEPSCSNIVFTQQEDLNIAQ
ncbi:MAG: hypothetical protein PHE96_08110 [Methylococcales bacterium]|nr:hypothetical protein [Methylococcales bacterium]